MTDIQKKYAIIHEYIEKRIYTTDSGLACDYVCKEARDKEYLKELERLHNGVTVGETVTNCHELEWIPVTERLPKKEGCYLVAGNYCWEGKPVPREAFWSGNGWFSCYDKHPIKPPVTHWMPLPQPPKETVYCKDCEHLMFSDCYGECGAAHKGIVRPDDTCEYAVRRKPKEGE